MLTASAPMSRLDHLYAAFQRGFVGVLFALKAKGDRHKERPRLFLTVFGVLYDAAQLLAFPLSPSLGWGSTGIVSQLVTALMYRNPLVAVIAYDQRVSLSIVGGLLLLLFVLTACLIYCLHGFATGTFKSVRPLQVLRIAAKLVVILQITVVERLASVFVCGNTVPGLWSSSTIACDGVTYAMLVVVTAILLLIFIVFSFVVSTVSFNREYGNKLGDGRVHGRVDGVLLVVRIVLTFLFASANVPTGVRLAAVLIGGAVFFGAHVRYLPELANWRNQSGAAIGALILWSSFCSVPAIALGPDLMKLSTLGVVYAVGFPGAILLGAYAVSLRMSVYGARVIAPGILRTPFDAELVARFTLAAADVMPEVVGGGAVGGLSSSVARVAPAAPVHYDAEASAAIARVRDMLNHATKELFPNSAMMTLLHANLVRSFPALAAPTAMVAAARRLLGEGLSRWPLVDVYFLLVEDMHAVVKSAPRAAEEEPEPDSTSFGALKLLALDDVNLRTTRTQLCHALLAAAAADLHLWRALGRPAPSAYDLDLALETFSDAASTANGALERLSRYASANKPDLMRLQGVFHLIVRRDAARAKALWREAVVEESFRHAHRAEAALNTTDAIAGSGARGGAVAASATTASAAATGDKAPVAGQSAVVSRALSRGIAIVNAGANDGAATEAEVFLHVWDAWSADLHANASVATTSRAAASSPDDLDVPDGVDAPSSLSSLSDDDGAALVPVKSTAAAAGSASADMERHHAPISVVALQAAAMRRAPLYKVLRTAILGALAALCLVLAGGVTAQIVYADRIASSTAEVTASAERSLLAERISRGVRDAALASTGLLSTSALRAAGANATLAAVLADAKALHAAHSALLSPPPLGGFLSGETLLLTVPTLSVTTMRGAAANATAGAEIASLSTIIFRILGAAQSIAVSPSATFSLSDDSSAFFVAVNAPGALRAGLGAATNFVIARGANAAEDARTAITAAAWAFVTVVLLAAIAVATLAVAFFDRTESLIAAVLLARRSDLNAPTQAAGRVLVALRHAAGSSSTFRALLKSSSLPASLADEVCEVVEEDPQVHNGSSRRGSSGSGGGGSSGGGGTARLGQRFIARSRVSALFSVPIALFSLIALLTYYVARARVDLAINALDATGELSLVRTAALAASSDARSVASDGLSTRTWAALAATRGLVPPACNAATLASSAADIAARTYSNELKLETLTLGPRTGQFPPLSALGSSDLVDVIFGPVCTTLGDVPPKGYGDGGVTARALGLQPLSAVGCSAAPPPLAVGADGAIAQPPGALSGLGANGLFALLAAHGTRVRELLPLRAAALASGAPCATSSLSIALPSAEIVDAAAWLLVDKGVGAVAEAAAKLQANALRDLVSLLVSIAVMTPVAAALAFGAFLSPVLKRAAAGQVDLARALLLLPHDALRDSELTAAVLRALNSGS